MGNFAIHWTKAVPASDGFFLEAARPGRAASAVLDQILGDAGLRGGNGQIRGGHTCVCFTEAPLVEMISVFASVAIAGQPGALRYEPYGIGVPKEWLFRQGARPVIYQPEAEYEQLPQALRWRHCRFEPPDIDFTWEREWRVSTERLPLDPRQTWVFVPNQEIADRLTERHGQWRVLPLELFGLPSVGDAVSRREA